MKKCWLLLIFLCSLSYGFNKKYTYMLWENFKQAPLIYVKFKKKSFPDDGELVFVIDDVQYIVKLQVFYDDNLFEFKWDKKIYVLNLNEEIYYERNSSIKHQIWAVSEMYKEKNGKEYIIDVNSRYRGNSMFLNRNGRWFQLSVGALKKIIAVHNYPMLLNDEIQQMNALFNPSQAILIIDDTVDDQHYRKLVEYTKEKK